MFGNQYLFIWNHVVSRSGDYASTAYVTFKEAHALETAVLLSVSFGSLLSICAVLYAKLPPLFTYFTCNYNLIIGIKFNFYRRLSKMNIFLGLCRFSFSFSFSVY